MSTEQNAVITEFDVKGFGHDLRVLWDERDQISIWFDGEQVSGVWNVSMSAGMGEHGIETKRTITLIGDDHPLAAVLAQSGFEVLIIEKQVSEDA